MRRQRPFDQVDVFSPTPYLGNPVAVILDAEQLEDSEMQSIARWTNLSETTFVLPPANREADYRLRIITPGGELPFAGHPTLGSAHAWLERGGTPKVPERLIQECGAGLVEVRRRAGLLSFAAPPTRRSGNIEPEYLGQLVDAFGIGHDQVLAHQWVDNGPGWAVVRLATAQEVLALQPDLAQIPAAMAGAIGAYPEGSEHAFELRTFAPGAGVAEDPVCGSMNAAVAQWLLRTGQVSGSYRVSQGQRLNRAGDVTITADPDGTVWVSGNTTTLFQGTALALPDSLNSGGAILPSPEDWFAWL
jgi:PhzF family phenazine biosynthesis protein